MLQTECFTVLEPFERHALFSCLFMNKVLTLWCSQQGNVFLVERVKLADLSFTQGNLGPLFLYEYGSDSGKIWQRHFGIAMWTVKTAHLAKKIDALSPSLYLELCT